MPTVTAAAFRASFAQRAMGILLFAGSWMVGLRIGVELVERLSHLWRLLKEAHLSGAGTTGIWILLGATVIGAALGLLLLAFSLLVVLMLEGTHVLVDDLGVAVEINMVPSGLARRLGAGRLAWKRISRIHRKGAFFILEGGAEVEEGHIQDPTLKFITVDELERLVLIVLEKSPNVKVD